MARKISERPPRLVQVATDQPGLKVDDVAFFVPPKGLNTMSRLSRVEKTFAVDIKNMMLDEGTLRSRYGTELFGGAAVDNIMALAGFVTPSQVGYFIRVTTTGLQVWNGASWDTVASNVFTGDTSNHFSFVGWGDEILLANGVNRIYRYNPETGDHGFIEGSPAARHITAFGGRVVATGVIAGSYKAYRHQWSVKNDSEDWEGDGSGFEDLFASPGGRVDTAHGVYPITDDTALVIRESSIWQMSVSGVLLAPFRFSKLVSEVGTRAPRSIAQVPGGVAFVTRENVVIAGIGNVTPIGDQIRDTLIAEASADWDAVVGRYDFRRNEYRIAIGDKVWRYNFRDQGWTKDDYPVQIRAMEYVNFKRLGIRIDSLSGTIDNLAGSIDDLVTETDVEGFFFVGHAGAASSATIRESSAATADVEIDGDVAAAEIILATALLQAGTVLEKTKVIEVQLEFESGGSQDILIEYSRDAGATWTTFSTRTVGATTGPTITSFVNAVEGHNIQLRLRSSTLGQLRVLAFVPRIVLEARVYP